MITKKLFTLVELFNNRIQCELITLREGTYQLHYTSNYFYSYEDLFQRNNSWDYEMCTGEPPEVPELWGIQIIEVSDDSKKVEKLLKKVKNVKVKSKVFTIIENEKTGQIYVGTNSPGLWVLDEKKEMIEKSNISFIDHSKREFGSIETFYKSRDGKIWIATTVGLCKLDPANKSVELFQPTPSVKDVIVNHINSLAEDADGNIWAGTVNSGLLKFNANEQKFYRYVKDQKNPFSISNNSVLSVFFDRSGILWVGYWGNGASKWNQKKWKFEKYEVLNDINDINDINDSKNKTITTMFEDKNRNLWMGTFGGLYNYNPTKKFLKYLLPRHQ